MEPDHLAFRFLPDGTSDLVIDWTYLELATRAEAVSAELSRRGISRGARVVLALGPGLDYVAGLFGIMRHGCTVVPSPPPIGRRFLTRFLSIVMDCAPETVLTDPRFAGHEDAFNEQLPSHFPRPQWIFPDGEDFCKESVPHVPFRIADPACLQYSSGSTGDPKGIIVTHANLVSNCEVLEAHTGVEPDRIGLSWLPPYHDMGLMGTILLAVHGGWPLVMMSPLHFVQDPYRWLKALTDHKVTITVGPNFAFDLCTTSIGDEQLTSLDLSRLRQVFCGSEPVSTATLDGFAERFGPACGFDASSIIPCYGMAEATLLVSGKAQAVGVPKTEWFDKRLLELGQARRAEPGDDNAVGVVSCGGIVVGHEVVVVDPGSARLLVDGQVGELWISGANVAAGYFNKPELTERTFGARLAGQEEGTAYLRSGDLGFMIDGELFVTGRLKDVIIISGRNLYPQDIEKTVRQADPMVRSTAAFTARDLGDCEEEVVVVAECRATDKEFEQAREALRDKVTAEIIAEHGVRPRVHFGPPGTVLMTTSGKVRRSATRAAYLAGDLKSFRTHAAPYRR